MSNSVNRTVPRMRRTVEQETSRGAQHPIRNVSYAAKNSTWAEGLRD